jgi:outer membrane protein OmpA-like peptidoglycan-associated protein/tetratricopeptide (TPR) repeat protein
MKTLIYILLVPMFWNLGLFQNFQTRQADKSFNKEHYVDAIKRYERIVSRDSTNIHAVSRLAHSYRLTNQFTEALQFYTIATEMAPEDAEVIYWHAQILKTAERYDESNLWMKRYVQLTGSNEYSGVYGGQSLSVNEEINKPIPVEVSFLSINSSANDFGVAFLTPETVVFASSRENPGILGRKNRRDHIPFFAMYEADVNVNNLENVRLFAKDVNSQLHDGPAVFTNDGREMFFTRNTYLRNNRSGKRINHLSIYHASLDSTGWSEPMQLTFNHESYSCGHPALSPDGQILYFVSDMPGGYGATDIYKVYRTQFGWGEPINLGSSINTNGREMFPSIDNNGTLWFASDGHITFGGLDILYSRASDNGFENPLNAGRPINSPQDDFALVTMDGSKGFFSSNRQGSSDNIYAFSVLRNPPQANNDFAVIRKSLESITIKPLLNDLVGDEANLLLSDFTEVTPAGGRATRSNQNEILYRAPENFAGIDTIRYKVCDDTGIGALCDEGIIFVQVLDSYYGLRGKILDKSSSSPISSAPVVIIDSKGGFTRETLTDGSGAFEVELDNDRIYQVQISPQDYIARQIAVSTVNVEPGVQEINELFVMDQRTIGLTFTLKILFDLGRSNIRQDAAFELDEHALPFLLLNPDVVVELSAHTDSRGNPTTNMRLSQQRAESTARYLIGKGVNPAQIVAKGYGQTMLLNHCQPGTVCSETEHEQNRRVEIKIIGSLNQ